MIKRKKYDKINEKAKELRNVVELCYRENLAQGVSSFPDIIAITSISYSQKVTMINPISLCSKEKRRTLHIRWFQWPAEKLAADTMNTFHEYNVQQVTE